MKNTFAAIGLLEYTTEPTAERRHPVRSGAVHISAAYFTPYMLQRLGLSYAEYTALNAAVRQRKISWNPCSGVELETPETAERRRWTPASAGRPGCAAR